MPDATPGAREVLTGRAGPAEVARCRGAQAHRVRGRRRRRGGDRHVPLPRLRAPHPRRARQPGPAHHRAGLLPDPVLPALPAAVDDAARRGEHPPRPGRGPPPSSDPLDATSGWPALSAGRRRRTSSSTTTTSPRRFPTAHPLAAARHRWSGTRGGAPRARGDPAHARRGASRPGPRLHRVRRSRARGCPGPSATRASPTRS